MIWTIIAVYILCAIYLVVNIRHDVHMLQQNSYRIDRYYRWLRGGDYCSAWRLADIAVIFILLSRGLINEYAAVIVAVIYAIVKSVIILRRKFKKPLVFTRRVWRIYSVDTLLTLSLSATAVFSMMPTHFEDGYGSGISMTLSVLFMISFLSWIPAIVSVWILTPVEASINRKYRNEAVNILRSMPGLTVVGITGSYGKTSTKHYLQRILSEKFEVLMTPGSYNTPMGVIRTVREMMKPYHEVFICEMGAKQVGDIKEICDMVCPHMGIITAVGPMHLESFRSIENVQKTKFELADALPSDGLAIVNNDFEYCANRKISNTACIRYGITSGKGCDYKATDITYSPDGTNFTVTGPEDYSLRLHTRLVGECNISDLLAAVVIARALGVSDDQICRAVADIAQVEHRLSVKRTPGGVTIIDDAFNSNPAGSKMAVDVLSQFKGGKRIIVTPGMIELGDSQHDLNLEFGRHIAKGTDVAVIVGRYNRESITQGIRTEDFSGELHLVDTFNDAQALLKEILRPGDTVLYENDLPDTFK